MAAQSSATKNVENKPNALPTLSPEEWMKTQRPPRVLIFGRRGAGKSSLFNCLIKKMNKFIVDCEYVSPDREWHSIDLKDHFQLPQQGVQEGQREQENQLSIEMKEIEGAGNKRGMTVENIETFKENFKKDNPPPIADVVLYVVAAGDVDAYIDDELKMLKAMYELWEEGKKPALITVLNRCDQLNPETLPLHKYEKQNETGTWQLKPEAQKDALNCTKDALNCTKEKLDKKLKNIERTKKSISKQISSIVKLKPMAIVPVVSKWDGDDGDCRWNIEELMIALIKNVPPEVILATARVFNCAQSWGKVMKRMNKMLFGPGKGWSWEKKLLVGSLVAGVIVGAAVFIWPCALATVTSVSTTILNFFHITFMANAAAAPAVAVTAAIENALAGTILTEAAAYAGLTVAIKAGSAAAVGGLIAGSGAVVPVGRAIYKYFQESEGLLVLLNDLFEGLFCHLKLESYVQHKLELKDLFMQSAFQCMRPGGFTEKSLLQTFIKYCEDRFTSGHNIVIIVKRGLESSIV